MTVESESGKRNNGIKFITRTAILLALTLALQWLRLPTIFTGPLVNFMLIISTALLGIWGGTLIGLFTPWIALLAGIIPAPLAPAIPFIMLGNTVYCLIFGIGFRYMRWGGWAGLVVGALLKFSIIAGAARYLLVLPSPVAGALLLPQLVNAIIGGIPAVICALYLLDRIRIEGNHG
ncbi:MAG: ECF transporter S component [Firmicutes bacterium]|nr:ECF transporter S component [Bacillota bacterium]